LLLPPVSQASVPAHFQSHFIIWRGGNDAAPQLSHHGYHALTATPQPHALTVTP